MQFDPTEASPVTSPKKVANQSAVSITPTDSLLTQQTAALTITTSTPEHLKLQNPEQSKGEDLISTKAQRDRERQQLIAKYKRTQEEYNKRPRVAFLSPTTKASDAAQYLANYIQRISRQGNAHYPDELRQNDIWAILIVEVRIRRDGAIHSISIEKPSSSKKINDFAKQLIRDAAPFEEFPNKPYFEHKDIISITRTFEFSSSGFANSDAGS